MTTIYTMFDRNKLNIKKLKERKNKISIESEHISTTAEPEYLSTKAWEAVHEASENIRRAKKQKAAVILVFGAHTIKNGMAPVLIKLMKERWVTHLATNGAGVIHDWEFAYQGKSSEEVQKNVKNGEFGIWHETGFFLNLAINIGAYEGLGYGKSIGKLIVNNGLNIPEKTDILELIREQIESKPDRCAAAADLLSIINHFNLQSGFMKIIHPYKKYSVQASAYKLNIPFTSHPMFGHDIIYNHPMNCGAAIGRTAEKDFLAFADSVTKLENGVYISVGSAVMSPMIFEKSLSMAQNIAIQKGHHIDNYKIYVVDIAKSNWDWAKNGEPPKDNPAYYLRYCKTFHRMGGSMEYIKADNRSFLLALCQRLSK